MKHLLQALQAPNPAIDRPRFPIQWSEEHKGSLRAVITGDLPPRELVDRLLAPCLLKCADGLFAEAERDIIALLRKSIGLCEQNHEVFISFQDALFTVQRFDLLAAMLHDRDGYGAEFTIDVRDGGPGRGRIEWRIEPSGEHRFIFNPQAYRQDSTRLEIMAFQWVFPLLAHYSLQPHPESGSVFINQQDCGATPGLAYNDYRPEFFLIPDCLFVNSRGYEYVRQHNREKSLRWEDRRPIALWRGSTTGSPASPDDWRSLERIKLCELARRNEHTGLIDAGIMRIAQFTNPAVVEDIKNSGLMRDFVPWQEWGNYKYLIDIDGNTSPWSNMFQRLLTGSPVLKVESYRGLNQWFYDDLIPWHNYVPIAPDMSDLMDKIVWLTRNDTSAIRIGQAGKELAERLTYQGELRRSVPVISAAFRYFRGERGDASPFGWLPESSGRYRVTELHHSTSAVNDSANSKPDGDVTVKPPEPLSELPPVGDLHEALRMAEAKFAEGNHDFALRLWHAVQEAHPTQTGPYLRPAAALRRLRRFPEAESLLTEAVGRFPRERDVLADYAQVAHESGNDSEALRRSRILRHTFPDFSGGYAGEASALRKLRQYAEAEAVAIEAFDRFPHDRLTLVIWAWTSVDRADWNEAARRWTHVRATYPDEAVAYSSGAVALMELKHLDQAEAILQQAISSLPPDFGVLNVFGQIAVRRGDWASAYNRWQTALSHFPNSRDFSGRMHEAQLRMLESDLDFAPVVSVGAPTTQTPAAARAEPDPSALMFKFESLGGILHGCEFGTLQRHFGAEPLGLLRWSDMAPEGLVGLLEARLEGVGLPENTELMLAAADGRREYLTKDKRFGMIMHTFVHQDEISFQKMFEQSCRRLQFLRRKFIEDLTAAEKIFVYKNTQRSLSFDELRQISAAMSVLGPATLLYVQLENELHRNGHVAWMEKGLLIGYIDNFATTRPDNDMTATVPSWLRICQNAYRLWAARGDTETADRSIH